jgi:hypothetical protein
MVDVQTIGVLVTAASVTIAAIYYVMNLRTSQNNMKMTLETRNLQFVTNISAQLLSEEGQKRYCELLNMEWNDYDDFERKYGSDNNMDSFAKRMWAWYNCNTMGMLREKLVEPDVLFTLNNITPCFIWSKFKDVIVEQRRRYAGRDYLSDFEFLNDELVKIKVSKDPSYKIPEKLIRYIPNK